MRWWQSLLGSVVLLTLYMSSARAQHTLKAGFIYLGPIGDYGWTHAHDQARKLVAQAAPWLETVYVEAVPEGQVENFIDQLVRQGAQVIFTTSFGYMDGTLAAAKRYPKVIFAHASGFKRAPNVLTYMAAFYQTYYLNGLMAGALSQSHKVGYVGAFPIPEVKRHIDAFTIGVREVNPQATVLVRWIFDWFNPTAAKEATEALLADGVDVLAFTEDSPTVVQVAAKRGVPSFGHYSPMHDFAPGHVVSGQLVHWEKIYHDILTKVHTGHYTANNLQEVDYWWLLAEQAVALGGTPGVPINPTFLPRLQEAKIHHPVEGDITVYDLVHKRLQQMIEPKVSFDPFQGPLLDRHGGQRVPAGTRLSVQELNTIEWAVQGVVGPWPNEP